MPHNENSRVKIPALVHFARLGFKSISLKNYTGTGLINEDTNIFCSFEFRSILCPHGQPSYRFYRKPQVHPARCQCRISDSDTGRENDALVCRFV